MKKTILFVLVILFSISSRAMDKDSTIYYNLPDSVKAVQFMTEVTIHSYNPKKGVRLRIETGGITVIMQAEKNWRPFFALYINAARSKNRGIDTRADPKGLGFVFHYDWQINETYKFLIAQATDSAAAITIYSGYVFLPKENKWKFIGSSRVDGWNVSLKKPSLNYKHGKKHQLNLSIGQSWVQRSNGSWKNLKGDNLPNPVINLFGHLDSAKQRSLDLEKMNASLKGYQYKDGVAYLIMKEGNGRQVNVTDTVSVYYHVNILNDTATIDEAKNTPARFPLNRLIRGWSIGVPLIKVGGKIRLVIPSDLAYSIRTRSAKIPPNSILEFIIEVVDAKAPQ